MLLSIDVGIRNLAMCLIDADKKIIEWEVDGIPPLSDESVYQDLLTHMNKRPWTLTCDTVLIEKQPDKNRLIKSVENFLHAYFLIHGKKVLIYDARHKIPDISGPGKVRYRQRKKASIDRCREFISSSLVNSHLVKYFDSHAKKDDLADTVMQALSYTPKVDSPKKVKGIKARKPTSNQEETRYSKSNLVWLYKNKKHVTKRFDHDLKLYYKTMDDFIKDIAV